MEHIRLKLVDRSEEHDFHIVPLTHQIALPRNVNAEILLLVKSNSSSRTSLLGITSARTKEFVESAKSSKNFS